MQCGESMSTWIVPRRTKSSSRDPVMGRLFCAKRWRKTSLVREEYSIRVIITLLLETCSDRRKCGLRGTALNKEIPHGVNRSDLQAHRLMLANINFYFMLKYHSKSRSQFFPDMVGKLKNLISLC